MTRNTRSISRLLLQVLLAGLVVLALWFLLWILGFGIIYIFLAGIALLIVLILIDWYVHYRRKPRWERKPLINDPDGTLVTRIRLYFIGFLVFIFDLYLRFFDQTIVWPITIGAFASVAIGLWIAGSLSMHVRKRKLRRQWALFIIVLIMYFALLYFTNHLSSPRDGIFYYLHTRTIVRIINK